MTTRCPVCDREITEFCSAPETLNLDGATPADSGTCPACGGPLPESYGRPVLQSPSPRIVPPQGGRIAHFELVRSLGAGSFGAVWLAQDLTLGRKVALKLPRIPAGDQSSLMFEAKTAAQLRHANIVSIYEVGNEHGQVYIASEFIDGQTLQDVLTQGKLSADRALSLLIPIGEALHFAHEQGVIHRDVKPANILVQSSGQPYITDFGLAKTLDSGFSTLEEGKIIGTVRYMSPEQAGARAREVDRRSDVYALGVVLFEMLTGDLPFRGNLQAILQQKTRDDPPSPRKLNPQVSRDLETICLRSLEREPARRYQTARDLVDELLRVQRNEPIAARPISNAERAWRWCLRRPAVTALAAGLLLSLMLGLFGVTGAWLVAVARGNAARRSLYHSWMNLASMHLTNGDIVGVKRMLARVETDPEMAALRGFEWDFFTGRTTLLVQVADHGDLVSDVASSADGRMCASVSQEPGVRVWDVESGRQIRALSAGHTRFLSLDFSPSANVLGAGAQDGFVCIWEPDTGDQPLFKLEHGPPVALVRFSPTGDRLLSAGFKGAVRLWDSRTGELLSEIPTGKRGTISDVRFAADGRRLYVATEDGHVRVWDLQQLDVPLQPERELDCTVPLLKSMALSDDGEWLVAGTYHGELVIRSLAEGSETVVVTNWGRIDDMEFLATTHRLAVVSSDGRLHLYDLDQRREYHALNTHGLATGPLSRSADGKMLVVGSGDGTVTRLRVADANKNSILWHETAVRAVEFLADGRQLVSIDESGQLRLWDVRSGSAVEGAPPPFTGVRLLSVQGDGPVIALAGTAPAVLLWHADKKRVVGEVPVGEAGVTAVRFSPDGRRFAYADRGGALVISNSEAWNQPLWQQNANEARVNALTFSDDSRCLFVARRSGELTMLDVSDGRALASILLPDEPVAVAMCDAGRRLVVGTAAGELHLYDARLQQATDVIKGHTGRINSLAALPGTETFVSGGRDRQLKLWDVASAELITSLTGHSRQVFAITVAPHGRTIVSGDLEGSLRIWSGENH